jgi:2-polyprenyl-6-methoxyphenol hydroxylase-like FAD-dependent oxidoreductase
VSGLEVLIVGAGPAGATLALCLLREGIRPVVVERTPRDGLRGYAVGLHVNGWNVAKRLGLLPQLQARDMKLGRAVYRDRHGHLLFGYDYRDFLPAVQGRMLAIMRDTLQRTLLDEVERHMPVRFGTGVSAIEPGEDGADVRFDDGSSGRFDLVVGADGIGSMVRDLVFGPAERFLRPLGYRAAAWRTGRPPGMIGSFTGHSAVDHQAGFYATGDGDAATLFCWRDPDPSHVPREQRAALLRQRFAGWHTDIAATLASPIDWSRSYFGTISQVVMPGWSSRRVVLLGDAAHCLTFFSGQGTSIAMAGAWILAQELQRNPVDVALCNYERRLRPAVEQVQDTSKTIAGHFIPASRTGLRLQALLAPFLFSRLGLRLLARRMSAPELAL